MRKSTQNKMKYLVFFCQQKKYFFFFCEGKEKNSYSTYAKNMGNSISCWLTQPGIKIGNLIFEMKWVNFWVKSIEIISIFYYLFHFLFVCCTKKLFEFPVERDFPKENAFNAAQHPFLFQKFLRIRFFDAEVRFFGTAI